VCIYIQYRMVTGQGTWQWTDLVANKRTPAQTLCDSCSTKADKILYHTRKQCPAPAYIHDLPQFVDLRPDPARIFGPQMSRKAKKTKGSIYPCKYTDCERTKRRAFRQAATANRHMQIVHKPTDAEYALLQYPVSVHTLPGQGSSAKTKNTQSAQPSTLGASYAWDSEREGSQRAGDEEKGKDNEEDEVEDDAEDEDEDVGPRPMQGRVGSDEDGDELVDPKDDEYEVECIVKHRYTNGRPMYRIKWVGTDVHTWEPVESLTHHMVRDYHAAKLEAAQLAIGARAQQRRVQAQAVLASGGTVRSRRVHLNKEEEEARRIKVDIAAQDYMDEGMNYHTAYDKAWGTVPL
jgi:hypothetical protein